MEVFHCESNADTKIPLYSGPCFSKKRPFKTQVCKKVMAAWAMGAPAFVYPEVCIVFMQQSCFKKKNKKINYRYNYIHIFVCPQEAGLPIGGSDFNSYIMLEVHYNNPGLRKGKYFFSFK